MDAGAPDAIADTGTNGTDAANLVDAGHDMDAACTSIGFQDDPNNCGYCGKTCGASAACTVGGCTTALATGIASAAGLALDSTHVYFTSPADPGGNMVYAVPLAGGAPTALVMPAVNLQNSANVTVAGGNVYWTITGTNPQVRFVPTAGGVGGALSIAENGPQYITNDGLGVFWTDGSRLRRADLGDGGVTTVPVAFDGSTPFGNFNGGIAVDATYVYWSGSPGGAVGQIFRANKVDGTGFQALSTIALDGIGGLTIDATNVYFTTFKSNNNGAVYSMPLAGGTPAVLFASVTFPLGIASDATSLYWADNFTSEIRKGPKAGGTPTTIAKYTGYLKTLQSSTSSTGNYQNLVVDGTNVYWIDQTPSHGALLKVSKN